MATIREQRATEAGREAGAPRREEPEIRFGFWRHCAIFLAALLVLIARRPDAIFHAQFWAEDGHVWIADAYNMGWLRALFRPWTGYFMTLPRIGAALAMLAPLMWAPLILNAIALCVQALPVNLLLCARSRAWGALPQRAALVIAYLVLPNCSEVSNGITEVQWVLALGAFLILVAQLPRTTRAWCFDIFVLALCGLTGPFCLFLFPIAAFLAWKKRERARWFHAGIFAVASAVQAYALVFITRSSDPLDGRVHGAKTLGAGFGPLLRIVGCDVYLGALIGSNGLGIHAGPALLVLLVLVSVAGTAILVFGYLRSGIEMRLLIVLTLLLFAASLATSSVKPPAGMSVWENLAEVGGIRYWFFPTLAFAWSLLICFRQRAAFLRMAAGYLLVFMCIGVVRDWRHPALEDMHYQDYVARLQSAPPGEVVTIPINPRGWEMRLIKRAP
jgi:hypothetical protein